MANFFRSKITDKFIKGFANSEEPQNGYEDPTYLGFRLRFNFDGEPDPDPETLLYLDTLFAPKGSRGDSAVKYLDSIGMPNRSRALEEFSKQFQQLITKYPYYIQSVDGLADFWKIGVEEKESGGEGFNSFRTANKLLTFELLESIDLRMTALADLYKKSTFDEKYMRDLLPHNLKWFSMTLDVAEMRNFHRIKKDILGLGGQEGQNSPIGAEAELEDLDSLISVISFRFHKCTFDFSEAFPVKDTIEMGGDPKPATSRFKVRVGRMEEKNYYTLLNYILASEDQKMKLSDAKYDPSTNKANKDLGDATLGTRPQGYYNNGGVLGKIAALGNEALAQIADRANEIAGLPANYLGRAINIGQAFATGGLLGNVYEDRNKTLSQLITPFLNDKEQAALFLEQQRRSSPERTPINENVYK